MNKKHFVILILTILMSLFSAYSLVTRNISYKIPFQWYSIMKGDFINEKRIINDSWDYFNIKKEIFFQVVQKEEIPELLELKRMEFDETIFYDHTSKYIYLAAGYVSHITPGFKVHFIEMAQKGSVVECKVNIVGTNYKPIIIDTMNRFLGIDVIRIQKDKISGKGNILFLLKNQFGEEIAKLYYTK